MKFTFNKITAVNYCHCRPWTIFDKNTLTKDESSLQLFRKAETTLTTVLVKWNQWNELHKDEHKGRAAMQIMMLCNLLVIFCSWDEQRIKQSRRPKQSCTPTVELRHRQLTQIVRATDAVSMIPSVAVVALYLQHTDFSISFCCSFVTFFGSWTRDLLIACPTPTTEWQQNIIT